MINLARHLEVLLLSNDCVAVPGFGGFVAHYVSAYVDQADGMFLPPQRTIGYNPQLKMNDSLLAQSYIETYDTSYPEALSRIEQEVDDLRRQIAQDGSYHLEGIGTLTLSGDDTYTFEPSPSGLLTPTLYGLSSFEFKPLHGSQPQTAVTPMPQPAATDNSQPAEDEETAEPTSLVEFLDDQNAGDADRTISIRMSWIRNTVAVAAAIILFLLMTTPVANSDMGSQTMSMLRQNVVQKLMPKDSNMSPAKPVTPAKPVDAKPAKEPAKLQQTPQTPGTSYCIVLASQVRRDNAQAFAEQMRQRGFNDTRVYIHNQVVRVVYGHFKTEADAYVELHNLRFEENFEEAWVYKTTAEG